MADYIVYGIKNCDTVKKALQWLDKKKVGYDFHDYKSKGVTEEKLKNWCKQVGWESLVNRKGMTWRQLDKSVQDEVTGTSGAVALMKEKTSVIKRPLIEKNGEVVSLGFDEKNFQSIFGKGK
jgi:Spx/MgsR family transcriptional regulator